MPEEEFGTDFKFSMIPEWILDHPKLSDGAVRTYGILARYANQDDILWPGQETVGERRRKDAGTIRRHFRELEAVGALVVKRKRFDSTTVYKLKYVPPPDGQNRCSGTPSKNARSVDPLIEGTFEDPVETDRAKSRAQKLQNRATNESQETDTPLSPPEGGKESIEVEREDVFNSRCPRCQASPGEHCRSDDGRIRKRLHRERHEKAIAERVHQRELARLRDRCPDCDGRGVILLDDGKARRCTHLRAVGS